jgi:hypothetical protein
LKFISSENTRSESDLLSQARLFLLLIGKKQYVKHKQAENFHHARQRPEPLSHACSDMPIQHGSKAGENTIPASKQAHRLNAILANLHFLQ